MKPRVLWLLLHIVWCANRVALVSFHGGNDPGQVNNIYRYDFADDPDTFVPLGPLIDNEQELDLRSPRGMLYNIQGDYLLHLNAYKKDSKIVKTSSVSGGNGRGEIFSQENLLHPYGIAMHPEDPHVYVSNQGTGDISRYTLDGAPTLGPVFVHVEGPRALAFDRSSNLWVADKNTTSLLRFAPNGTITKAISVVNPIGLAMYQDRVFVSSDNGPDGSAVYSYRTDTGGLSQTYRGPSGAIHHPCGLVIDGPSDSLYVMSQSARQIVRFELSTATYVGPVITGLEDVPEHIIIIPYVSRPPSLAPTNIPTTEFPTLPPTESRAPTPAVDTLAPSSTSISSSSPTVLIPTNYVSPITEENTALSIVEIILIALGGLVLILLFGLFLYCRSKRRKPHALLAYEEQYRVN